MSTQDELKPTVGLRIAVDVGSDTPGSDANPLVTVVVAGWQGREQAIIDAAYINQCIEEHEQRALQLKRPDETGDLMVDLGDLKDAKLGTMVQDESFELQVIDYIDTLNNAVLQGIPPFRAVRAMSQAFSVVLGNCIRAGLHPGLVAAVLEGVIQATKAAGKRVKVITSSQH